MYVATTSLTVRLVRGQLGYLQEAGFEVILVSSAGEELRKAEQEGVRTVAVEMAREISPLRDLVSLWRLMRVMRRLRPTLTNVGTPKAGLLGGLAAWLCGVPCRYYMLRGLRCETATGVKRKVLMAAEAVACRCAHRVICVSESLRQKAIELGLVEARRAVVLGGGCNGVDTERFAPTEEALRRAKQIREKLKIPVIAPVVGFVGRLTKDKGINELVETYCELRKEMAELRLLLVGEMEEGDPLTERTRWLLENEPGIVRTGFVDDPTDYYHVLDVFAFPTYREGFPNVVLEANAAGKPVAAARATGVVDAVVDGVTGLLVPVGDAAALAGALKKVIEDREMAAALGSAGRERVVREFRRERVWEALEEEYRKNPKFKIGKSKFEIADPFEAQDRLKFSHYTRHRAGLKTGHYTSMMKATVKRAMDVVVAGLALAVFWPVTLAVGAAIRVCDGAPVVFRQKRPGLKGRPFTLLKFRTMREARDKEGRLLADEARLTALGQVLRELSLDELPQLWNVLRGEMSLVGPRPLLMEYLERYSAEEMRRHEVKPGITGWAQVNGRNATSWEERFALDVWYVENWSLALDVRILMRTLWTVMAGEGVAHDGHVSMPEFLGSERGRS
jgi:lipopolysaccharide/colanic/teichoic acid biosynthesis glycosyltransferase/glycosyltransferase involved in cell wall biosynthesis